MMLMGAKQGKVLVVDDDAHITHALETRLCWEGFEVLSVNDAHQAAELVFGFRPDVVVLDIDMPSYTGLEFHACLTKVERGRSIPVIYLTGNGNRTNRAQARRQNAFAFMTKPYEASSLVEVLQGAIAARLEATSDATEMIV